jgi:hypothetical protein
MATPPVGAGDLAPVRTGARTDRRRKHYFVSLPATASLSAVVRLAHQGCAIEQHYQDLKSELGLDHFEGRTYPICGSREVRTLLQKAELICACPRCGAEWRLQQDPEPHAA